MNQIVINLTQGIVPTVQYEVWKFPGGEIHMRLQKSLIQELDDADKEDVIFITTRINNSDDLIFLCLMVDTIAKNWSNKIGVYMPYMPYQQADRDFGIGECFSLKTIANILNSLPVESFNIFDAHSDVSPALLRNCAVIDNTEFINAVFNMINAKYERGTDGYFINDEMVILSPDAGAYKKIFKLAEKIGFKGAIETANKYRDTSSGELQVRLSCEDFKGKDVLIIDDICIGGRTFNALAEQLKDKNVGNLYLAVSHGIFSAGIDELAGNFKDIFTTNSRRNSYESLTDAYNSKKTEVELQTNGAFQLHVYEVI